MGALRNKEKRKDIRIEVEEEEKEKREKKKVHPPGLEPGSPPWKGGILPLDHECQH